MDRVPARSGRPAAPQRSRRRARLRTHPERHVFALPVRLRQSLAVREFLRRRGHVQDPIRRVRLWWELQTCGRLGEQERGGRIGVLFTRVEKPHYTSAASELGLHKLIDSQERMRAHS